MAQKRTRKEKGEEINRRFEIIKNLMSSFVVGTAAIVAAVVFIPASPKAEIIKIESTIDLVAYQVTVTDEDNALDLSTLVVTLENQFEYYETPISLGENSGYFEQLEANTEYWLNIYGSKGFGQERLDSRMVRTRASVGGMILNVDKVQLDFETSYVVDVSINDPDQIYQSVTLYYGYAVEWEPDLPIQYSAVSVSSNREEIELFDIYTTEPFHIYLEGMTADGAELLDDIWVTPPFELYSSMYVERMNDDAVYFSIYGDMQPELEIAYQLNAYIGNILIKSVDVDIGENDYHDIVTGITGLSSGKTYRIEGIATYKNPITLRRESSVIYEEEITTLEDYNISYSVTPYDDYLEITITLRDPNHYFQVPSYEIYEIIDGQEMWLNSESSDFILNGDEKTVTFNVYIPVDTSYRLSIEVQNQTDFTIRHVIYDEIIE